MNHRFKEFQPFKGEIPGRINGSPSPWKKGMPFLIRSINSKNAENSFVAPNEEVYTGQVIGENSRGDDMVVNVTKTKKLSNVRAAGADDKVKLAPPLNFLWKKP